MAQQNLASKIDIAALVKKTDFDDKLKKFESKNYFKQKHTLAKNELQTFDPSLFVGQSYFFNDGAQIYLIFQTLCYTLKRLGDTEIVASWRSKGFSA